MPEYHFTGTSPRVLTGLSQGVNATLRAGFDRADPPYGATLEASFGDAIRTDEPYDHPELEEVFVEPQHLNEDGTPSLPPEPVVPIQLVAADSTPEQIAAGLQAVQDAAAGADGLDVLNAAAHDSMTAEGAPAPAEPTN